MALSRTRACVAGRIAQLVVAGAVLLASKVQESPRGLDDVAHVCFEAKHANKRAAWPTEDKVRSSILRDPGARPTRWPLGLFVLAC